MFSRRWIINYILIFLIILFTYVGNRFDVETGYQKNEPVSTLGAADIETVEIKTGDVRLALSRQGEGWRIDSPIGWPADRANVERLVAIVERKTEAPLSAEQIDPDVLGLDLPKALLRLNDTTVLFGATNNIGERRYVKIGAKVYLLPDVHLPFVAQGLPSVLDRRLLPPGIEPVRLELPDLTLMRGADDSWQDLEPGRFDAQRLQTLIDNWRALPASRVKAWRGSGTPRQKIAAELADGARLEFFLMSIEPEIILANPQIGMQYHFRNDRYYQLIALKADANNP